jgi:UTP--glucose-1-phosphate uridylyltransferase
MNRVHRQIDTAVIPMAGMGTRMFPISSVFSKSMLPLGVYPAIFFLLNEIKNAGIKHVHIICDENIKAVFQLLNSASKYSGSVSKYPEIRRILLKIEALKASLVLHFHLQDNKAAGLGGALLSIREVVKSPFVLLLGDDIHISSNTIQRMLYTYSLFRKPLFLISTEKKPKEDAILYGRVRCSGTQMTSVLKISHIYEKTLDKKLNRDIRVVSGRYILDEKIYRYILEDSLYSLETHSEIELTDGINLAIQKGELVYGFKSLSIRYDLGRRLDYYKLFMHQAISEFPELRYYLEEIVKNEDKGE